jgi:hypothetical protein
MAEGFADRAHSADGIELYRKGSTASHLPLKSGECEPIALRAAPQLPVPACLEFKRNGQNRFDPLNPSNLEHDLDEGKGKVDVT